MTTTTEYGQSDAVVFLDHLYANKTAYLERDSFATIGEANEFYTKIVGVTFEGRQDVIGGLTADSPLDLIRDPQNAYDPNAIGVWFGSLQLGFLRAPIARRLAPNIDDGARYNAVVGSLTGGGARSHGVNIHVTRDRPKRDLAVRQGASAYTRGEILRALLGDRPLRDSQQDVLAHIDSGANTLAVMGTGRGKSLCFQYPAAVAALERGAKTVVLYPLRALANDQYEALQRRLGPLGLRIFRANGSITSEERADLFTALETGEWDIICATPEFFTHHLERFGGQSAPALVVVDEAHHIHASGHRPAYGRIGEAVAILGSPQVLALTATADDIVFERIRESLQITAWVIDPTVRDNLHMIDARGTTNKLAYIVNVLREPGKAIVYCNSRTESTKLAEKLRSTIPDVAFYHAGVPSVERGEIERMFRENALRVVVATSAFGEGIDLPDVRNVFLVHLNFDFTEFNQQSGRAGRDGDAACIHLLFGKKDRNLNEFIIDRAAPPLPTLRAIYRELTRMTAEDGTIRSTFVDLAATMDINRVDGNTISTAARIFVDEGLAVAGVDDDGKYLRIFPSPAKVDLTQNDRFVEGEAEREQFAAFCDVVLTAAPEVLENVVNRPIYPSRLALTTKVA